MRILITGARGRLGGKLAAIMAVAHQVIGVDIEDFDLTDFAAVTEAVSAAAPELIIHCAAMTDVDGCERDQPGAMSLHAAGVGNLVRTGLRLVTVSTDQVFDSGSPDPLFEDDPPAGPPVNAYARSKLAG